MLFLLIQEEKEAHLTKEVITICFGIEIIGEKNIRDLGNRKRSNNKDFNKKMK